LQDSAKKEESIFASKIAQDIPTTNSVVEFCQMFDAEKVTEAWQSAWRSALVRSALSHILCKKFFSNSADIDDLTAKLHKYPHLVPDYTVERSPYSELKGIITKFHSSAQFWNFVQDPAWDDVQTIMGTCLKTCPPIFLYLDASDDEFAHAPMDWHRCQKGLFYAVMRFLRQPGAIGSRLHVVAALRDIVYSSVLESEHRTRYVNVPSICLLDWSREAISFFLARKIEALPDIYFNSKRAEKTLENFLGLGSIANDARDCVETAENYLIRHTRCLPRDIIQIGNALASAKREYGTQDKKRWERRVKTIIGRSAALFADEQIEICANQLSSHDAPAFSAKQRYADFYTSNKEYIDRKKDVVKDFISLLGKETFTYNELTAADGALSGELPDGVRISTILWQNGLLGTRRRSGDRNFEFYSLGNNAGFMLPDNYREYAFRSIVIDVMPKIELTRSTPVEDFN
jgi:hypothetical protein